MYGFLQNTSLRTEISFLTHQLPVQSKGNKISCKNNGKPTFSINFKLFCFIFFFRKLVLEVNKIVSYLHSQKRLDNSPQDSPQCDLSVQMSGICNIA